MKHLYKLFVLLLTVCLLSLSAFTADAASSDVIFKKTSGSITVTVYENGLAKYTGSGILSKRIYEEHHNVVKIEIGEGITKIGEEVFREYINLKSVKFPSTLTTIGPRAFYQCEKLSSVKLPDGLKKIGSGAFIDCALTSITIPDSVTSLAYDLDAGEAALGAFDCPKLSKVTLGKGITTIPYGCFSSTLIESITIPDNVTRIEEYAFSFCPNLTSITIPAKVKYIGSMAFVNDFSLTTVIFRGDLPKMDSAFHCGSFNAAAYYPKDNSTWDNDPNRDLGDLITAVPCTVSSSGSYTPVAPSTEQVASDIAAFTAYQRPAGTPYPDNFSYVLNGKMSTFYGKEAFAVEMSDYCFGYMAMSVQRTVSYSKLKLGDILYEGSNVWVITEKTSTGLKLAGVQNGVVCYDVSMTKAEAEAADAYRTRVGVILTAGPVDPSLSAKTVKGPDHKLTEAEAYEKLLALRTKFPEGMSYSSKNHYRSNIIVMLDESTHMSDFGHGCSAFGGYASDVLFGKDAGRYTQAGKVRISNLMVGDRILSTGHEMIVLEVYSDCVIVAEGNYDGRMHWGRKITAAEIARDYARITRYPKGTKAPARTAFTCTHKYFDIGTLQEDGELVYTCNSCGKVFHPTPLKITQQPTTVYTQKGATAKIPVKANGDNLKYTWYFKNAGASKYTKSSTTKSTYSITMTDKIKDRQVYCVITDQYGNSVQTKTVYLRMAATITQQPQTVSVASGVKAKVPMEAIGDGLTYTWYYKNASATKYTKSSVTKSTYSVTMSDKIRDRQIYCVVTDQYGNSVTSDTVYLRMAATITQQPKTVSAANGATAKVPIKASGDGLTYTWYFKNAGATKYTKSSTTKSTYSITMSDKIRDRQIYCVVTDQYGNSVTSDTVYLRMAVTITQQPKTVTVASGIKAKTTVEASGDGLTYTWYYKNASATKYTKSSITKATYSVTMSDKINNRKVYCVITDKYGNTVQTNTVTLKMKS